jgi:RNA polymerase sigma factor (TIGR02999 family)
LAFILYLRNRREKTFMPPEPEWSADSSRPEEGLEVQGFFSLWYAELHRQAASALRKDRNATINPTALVNEAFLKLQDSPEFGLKSNEHCFGIAARAMRQVLVDEARRRNARKRGGAGEVSFTTLGEFPERQALSAEELLALNSALDKLARMNPRQAQMVELRFFAGQNMAEVAKVLDVAKTTVERDWIAVKAWLAKEIRGARW